MVLALNNYHTQKAIEAQNAVTEATNEMLTKNAEALHQSGVETAKASERGIVDIETLQHTNEQLIAALDEIQQIQADGKIARANAELELARIEQELKDKMLSIAATAGKSAEDIYEAINGARDKVRASFVLDQLIFLSRGGRCNAVTALLANALKLKPRIEVKMGKMGVGTKYRGKMQKVLISYVDDMKEDLLKADKRRVFVTYCSMDHELVQPVVDYLKELNYFDEILETQAGGVITSHCGPGTLGVLFYLQ